MTIGVLAGLFFFVLCAVTAAGYLLVLRPARIESTQPALPASLAYDQGDLSTTQAALVDLLRLLGEMVPVRGGQEEVRQQLSAAGYRWPTAVAIFLGIKAATALLFGVGFAWLSMLQAGSQAGLQTAEFETVLVAGVAGLGLGYLFPDRVLRALASSRSMRLRQALPAALDLMVLAIEAGQGLDAAILDTSRGLRATHPDLASEFTQLHLELRTTTTRVEALKNFAARGRDQELRKFANLLIDTDRFGTSLGPALKTHARYLRIRFRQKAQETARKIGVKLIFPVFFLIFPSVILVTLGPAVMQLMGSLDKMFGL
jgi:tight adherence protein C